MAVNFHLTDVGRLALLNADDLQLDLHLTHIAFGLGKYNSGFASKKRLLDELVRYPLTGGKVISSSATLQLVAEVTATMTADIFEVGFFTESGVLFAIASQAEDEPILMLVNQVTSLFTFGMSFSDAGFDRVVVTIAPDSAIATVLMNDHLSHPNPHPQYAMQANFEQFKTEISNHFNLMKTALAESIWRVYSWHGVDDVTYDPSIALEQFFGYRTVWRLRPYAPYGVETLSEAILQKLPIASNTGLLALNGPIWKRMPDDFKDPEYALIADKNSINEGQSVTFTLQTQNLPENSHIAWQISGVITDDISPSETNGFFVINDQGRASYAVQAVSDLLTEGNETLRLSLIDDMQIYKDVLIVDSSTTLDPTYSLSANKSMIDAGDSVTVTLTTTDVPDDALFSYSITGLDASSLSSASGNFVVQNNQATITFDVLDMETQRDITELTITLMAGLASTSITKNITSSEIVIHPVGEHEVIVYPNETKYILLVGGGGGGGSGITSSQLSSAGDNVRRYFGKDGVQTSIAVDGVVIASAGGGEGGVLGWYDNGSAWGGFEESGQNTGFGTGGLAVINESLVKKTINKVLGNDGSSDGNSRSGGASVSPENTGSGAGGAGGAGASGNYKEYAGIGAGGGSGASIEIHYKNNTSEIQTLTLVVGGAGLGGEIDLMEGMDELILPRQGEDGKDGIAITGGTL